MMPRHVAVIRLVTERYRELQGLRAALIGAVNLIVFGASYLAGGYAFRYASRNP